MCGSIWLLRAGIARNMDTNIIVFAGTTEGREAALKAAAAGFRVTVSVASEYGREDFVALGGNGAEGVSVLTGRLDADEMRGVFVRGGFRAAIDATHPFAALVSENIRRACEDTGVRYFRIARRVCLSCAELTDWSREFKNIEELCNFLAETKEPCYSIGNIFVSTGSKEIGAFARVPRYKERVFARVLPSPQSLAKCAEAGLPQNHVIAMQGPFSAELNAALFREYDIKLLVTKESGAAGGLSEKLAAAKECGVISLLVKPPDAEGAAGYDTDEVLRLISNL